MKKLAKYYFLLLHSITIFGGGSSSKPLTIKAAIEKNNIEKIKELLKIGLCLEDQKDALHLAILKNNKVIVQMLLEAGVLPNISKVGVTPLHFAAREGSTEIIELLLCYDALPREDLQKFTPFHHSIMSAQLACLEFFLTTPIPSSFSSTKPFKSSQEINKSKDRIKTFLYCLKKNHPTFPANLKFQILSWMPLEIFSQKMLRVMLEKYPSDFNVFMRNCPQKWLIPSMKNLPQEKTYEETLTNNILFYANELSSNKIKFHPFYETSLYELAKASETVNKDPDKKSKILKLLDPNNETARKELIKSHIQKLKNE